MNEIRIDKRELEQLIEDLDASPEVLRAARRAAFEASAPLLLELLESGFRSAGLIAHTGRLLGWQETHLGSRGGYAAVRPAAKTFSEVNGRGKKYAAGAVTNAVESGHRFPNSWAESYRAVRGKMKKYRYRTAVVGSVKPYPFYAFARPGIAGLARETADRVLQNLIEYFE